MKITCKLTGFEEGKAELRKAKGRLKKAATKALQEFGDAAVEKLKTDAKAGAFGPAKKRDDGNPPLIRKGVYINSYVARASGFEVDLCAEGMNTFLSNEDLADLLEYGFGDTPAHPHLRPLTVWIEQEAPARIGDRLFQIMFSR